MKVEAEIIEMEKGIPTVLEYEGVLFFHHPPVKEKKQKPRFRNPYAFRR
jgi:hypothetical protein